MSFESELFQKFQVSNSLDLMKAMKIEYRGSGKYYWNGDFFDDYDAVLRAADESVEPSKSLNFLFSTTHSIEGKGVPEVLGVVAADCAYGMNVFRDIFASVRDFVGGRSKATEKVLRDAKDVVKQEMAEQAVEMGAEAIVGLAFDVTEMGGGLKAGMLLVSGTGTAVKFVRAADPASERGG